MFVQETIVIQREGDCEWVLNDHEEALSKLENFECFTHISSVSFLHWNAQIELRNRSFHVKLVPSFSSSHNLDPWTMSFSCPIELNLQCFCFCMGSLPVWSATELTNRQFKPRACKVGRRVGYLSYFFTILKTTFTLWYWNFQWLLIHPLLKF